MSHVSADCEILIVDFDDSFTYNIAEVLYHDCKSLQVVNYRELTPQSFSNKQRQVVIFGPGPGHPREYLDLMTPIITQLRAQDQIFLLGICLGHQLILSLLGLSLERACVPIHGRSFKVECFDGISRSVQFYNSLFVKGDHEGLSLIKNSQGEILSARGERILTYQFHPESVGTSYPTYFFGMVRDFLYNK